MPPSRILFLDDRWVAGKRGLRRRYHEAVKHEANPVLRPSEPWEEDRIYVFGTVLPTSGGGYRIWYQTCSKTMRGPDAAMVCVAESNDLVAWSKPRIGCATFQGRRESNIVLKCSGPRPLYSPSILLDETEPDPTRRYKMLFWDTASRGGARGCCAAFSPDGLRWSRSGNQPLFTEPNDVLVAAADPGGGFVCYQTLLLDDPAQDHPRDNLRGKRRVIGRRTSADFVDWSGAELVLQPDSADPPDMQFYGLAAWPDDDIWIGLLWTYHAANQTSDVQLAWSEDGRSWRRPPERTPLIRLGGEGEFDSHLIFTASAPVDHGGRTWIAYGGHDGPHDSPMRGAAIGMAALRRDGWCSLAAGGATGELTTSPLPFGSSRLSLNIDTSKGVCIAEFADAASGKPLPGRSFTDCIPIEGVDSLEAPLRWRAAPAEPPAPGRWVLRLRLRNAALYAVQAD